MFEAQFTKVMAKIIEIIYQNDQSSTSLFKIWKVTLLKVVMEAMNLKSKEFYQILCETNFCKSLLASFTLMPNNNILHCTLVKIIINIINSDSVELKKSLIEDA